MGHNGLQEHGPWLILLGVDVQEGHVALKDAHDFTEEKWEEREVEKFKIVCLFDLLL